MTPTAVLAVTMLALAGAQASPTEEVRVSGGVAVLGADAFYPEEGPAVEVTVGDFWIDRFEVTNRQFGRFVDKTGWITSAERATELGFPTAGSAVFDTANIRPQWRFVAGAQWRHPEGPGSSIEGRPDEPVVQVSREDAEAFARWAGRRLPTEAEWEWAASSGIEATRDSGRPPMANTWQGSFPEHNSAEDGFIGRSPVGSFTPSDLGLYDMLGNVWEWTSTHYLPSRIQVDAGTDLSGHDPRQPDIGVGVIKGGSFLCAPTHCYRFRPGARQPQDLALGTNHLGFRTASSSSPSEFERWAPRQSNQH